MDAGSPILKVGGWGTFPEKIRAVLTFSCQENFLVDKNILSVARFGRFGNQFATLENIILLQPHTVLPAGILGVLKGSY